jgi:hypothetical protein
MVKPTPIYGQLLLLVKRSRKAMKQTTDVSGNQTPEACSLLSIVSMRHVSGACQSHSCPVLSLREASWKYVELSHSTPPFLTLRFHEKDILPTPRLLRVRPILPPLGHILSSIVGCIFDFSNENTKNPILISYTQYPKKHSSWETMIHNTFKIINFLLTIFSL